MLLDLILRTLSYTLVLNFALIPSHFKPLTVEKVFSADHIDPVSANPEFVTLLVTGDILPGRSVQLKYVQNKDPNFAFSEVAPILREADLVWANLEGPLVEGCPVFYTGFTFCGDPELAEGLGNAGIDVANIANNHIYNFGGPGRSETVRTLKEAGIGVSGEEQIHYRTVKGIRFAFLGFDAVGKYADRGAVAAAVGKARENSDAVLVQFHWGQEYTYLPRPAGENPVSLGRFAVDSGADLVIGNHPHWVQGMELYQGKPIVYSHGNFVFDQMWSQETREGMVGKYVFYRGKLVDVEFLPVKIDPPFVPRFLGDAEKERMRGIIEEASRLLRGFTVLKY